MNEKIVSIIVPIYNVEKYIKKCVESLLLQDYPAIEIILVNDGSPDNCAEIINKLEENNTEIKVIHKENGGVSSARNCGIEIAKGEYIMFVDGDDWVDSNYVSYFVDLIEKSKCDIGMNKYNYAITGTSSTENRYIVSAEKAIEWIYLGDLFVAVWNKIYKSDLLKKNQIKFDNEIWYGEGMLFNIECLQFVEKVAIGEKSVYHQTFNPDSAMRSFNLESNLCGIRSLEIQKKLWKKVNKKIENAYEYHMYWFNRTIIDGLVRADMVRSNKEIFNECVRNIRKKIYIPFKVEQSIKRKVSWTAYFFAPMIMAKRAASKYKNTLKSVGGGINRYILAYQCMPIMNGGVC